MPAAPVCDKFHRERHRACINNQVITTRVDVLHSWATSSPLRHCTHTGSDCRSNRGHLLYWSPTPVRTWSCCHGSRYDSASAETRSVAGGTPQNRTSLLALLEPSNRDRFALLNTTRECNVTIHQTRTNCLISSFNEFDDVRNRASLGSATPETEISCVTTGDPLFLVIRAHIIK